MAKGSGMKKVNVVHCKPMQAGGMVGRNRVMMNNPKTAAPAPFKKGGVVVRGTGAAIKGTKFTGPNG